MYLKNKRKTALSFTRPGGRREPARDARAAGEAGPRRWDGGGAANSEAVRSRPAARVSSGAACLGGLGPQPPASTRGGLAGKARAGQLPAVAPTPTRHPPQDRGQTQTRSHPGLKCLELNLSFSSQTLTEGPLHAEAPRPGDQTRPKVVPGSPPDRHCA